MKLHHPYRIELLHLCMHEVLMYLSAVEECRLEEEEAVCNKGAVAVKMLAGVVVEAVSDSDNPVVHEVVTSAGDASVVCPFRVELAVFVTLDGWVTAPGRGLNKSVANCGLFKLAGGVTAGGWWI